MQLTKQQLKQFLLDTGFFIENEALNDYINLINTNIYSKPVTITHYMEQHHTLPVAYYKHKYNCKNRIQALAYANADPKNMLVFLTYEQHCLAHYLLYKCTIDFLKQSSLVAVQFIKNTYNQLTKKHNFNFSHQELIILQNYYDELINDCANNYWTAIDINFLITNYPDKGQRYCAQYLNKSLSAVSAKASNLGLKMNKWWSKEEIECLKNNYKTIGILGCMNILQKSYGAIVTKAKRLGLTKNKNYSKAEIEFLKQNYPKYGSKYCATILNKNAAAIKRWCVAHHILGKSNKRKIYCIELAKEFESISDASNQLKISDGNIWSVLNGKLAHTKGYTFKYLERK